MPMTIRPYKLMTLRHFSISVLILFGLATTTHSEVPDEVADKLDIAMVELNTARIGKSILDIAPVGAKHLEGFTDAERIQGVGVCLYRQEPRSQVYGPALMGSLLTNDPGLIKDTSELRRMLATERDPRRFFLLSCFGDYFLMESECLITHGIKYAVKLEPFVELHSGGLTRHPLRHSDLGG